MYDTMMDSIALVGQADAELAGAMERELERRVRKYKRLAEGTLEPEKAAGYPSWSWKVISRLENFTSCCMMQSRTASNPSYPPSGNRRVINASPVAIKLVFFIRSMSSFPTIFLLRCL